MSSIRACSTAGCRPSPIRVRCGSPAVWARWRAWSATRRKSMTSAFRSMMRCGASRASTSPITARCGGCSPACIATSAPPCWSIAIPCRRRAGQQGRAAAAGIRARRPLRHQLRRRGGGDRRGDAARAGLYRQPQQALCRRLHHRALRQSGRRAARHPARDQPRALHGRAPLSSVLRLSPAWRRIWRRWRDGWAKFPLEELRPYRAAAE